MLSIIPRPAHSEELPGTSTAPVTLIETDAYGAEGYRLEVLPETVTVAGTKAGQFYARQTLRQLRQPDGSLPGCRITDAPRFAWRGLMLDVSRHFFTVAEIKHFLDVMAAHKLNVFHWHLVDDHGWRIEIKKYPRLTEIGAWRDGIGFGLDPGASRNYRPDGRYGGFYTPADIRDVVAYAGDRHITVVPEIEMPGHSAAALAAYPEYSCAGTASPVPTHGGIYRGVYCAGKEETFAFLENILAEVIALFSSPFIHIGGDEVPKDHWQQCPRCQARHLDPEALQSYFIQRIEEFLNAQGRRLIGWDEILEGGLAPNATVMSWRGINGGVAAATAGHDVVMTPNTHCYFDYYQLKTGQPKAIGGYVPWDKVYEFEPIAAEIPADKHRHVLGGGANLWTEYIPNYGHLQFMAWPRACALAEVLWSPRERRELTDFHARLKAHTKFLDSLGVLYARPIE
jgi:hexosaminidase